MSKKQRGIKRIFAMFFAILFTFCSLSVGSIEAEAHDAYFLGVAFDSDSCRYIGTVSFQSNSLIGDNHAEAEITCDFHKLYTASGGVPEINYSSASDDDMETTYSNYKKNSSFANDKELLFTFPGFHTKGVATHKMNANGSDELLAERINNTVLGNLNSAIDFICEQTDSPRTNAQEIRTLAAKLANAVPTNKEGNSSGSTSFPFGGSTVSVSYGKNTLPASANIEEKDIPKGFTPNDYVEITVNGKSACFVYQAWKGYKYPGYSDGSKNNKVDESVDPYAKDVTGNDWYKDVGKNSVCKIGWDALVLQAHYNKDICGVEFSNLGTILPSNALVSAIAGLCDNIITGIRSFLGLYALDELMLNKGTRGLSYSMGLFPNGWIGPILLMFTICLMLTWAVMGFAVIKIFMKRSLATINVGEKMNIMNELKNLAVCCFMLGAFPLIFNMLARINYSLVTLFGSSTEFTSVIKSFYTLSQANFGSIIACFMGLALQIYFNFFYILRAITIAILYGIAPLAIYTIVLGGKNAKVFGAWSKELMSNIFVQTIHALMIAFFTSVSAVSGLKTFESIVVLYSFIPLTKFVKQNVFQASDGIGGMASNLSDMAKGGAGAMAGAAMGGGSSSGGSGGTNGSAQGATGGSGGSGGSGGGVNTGILADRMAQSKMPGQKSVGNSFSDNAQANITSNAGQKAANWVDGEHKTAVGRGVAGAANMVRNARDSAQGYRAPVTAGLTPLNKDDKIFDDAGEKQRDLGNVQTGGRSALGKTFKMAGSMAKAGANIAIAGAEMGMALGSSAYGGQGADRLFRQASARLGSTGSIVGDGIRSVRGSNDKQHLQHMKNHGIKSMSEDSKYLYKTMEVKYDTNTHMLAGPGLERMSDAHKSTLLHLCQSVDKTSNQNKQERAFYQTQLARTGGHIGLMGDGTIVMKYDKNIMNQNRATDYVTYGSAMQEYRENPMSGKQDPAPSNEPSEVNNLNEPQGGPTPSPSSSGPQPSGNPAEKPSVNMPSGGGNPNPNRNPRPIEDEDLKPSAPEPIKESPQVKQAIQEEEDYIRDSFNVSQEELDMLMQNNGQGEFGINAPGMYGNPNPSDFSKGTNPRGKK